MDAAATNKPDAGNKAKRTYIRAWSRTGTLASEETRIRSRSVRGAPRGRESNFYCEAERVRQSRRDETAPEGARSRVPIGGWLPCSAMAGQEPQAEFMS
jgi:hypothetical protein